MNETARARFLGTSPIPVAVKSVDIYIPYPFRFTDRHVAGPGLVLSLLCDKDGKTIGAKARPAIPHDEARAANCARTIFTQPARISPVETTSGKQLTKEEEVI